MMPHLQNERKNLIILIALVFLLPVENLAFAESSSSAIEWTNQCIRLAHDGKYQEAIEACSGAIELDPKLAAVYINRGNAHSEFGDRRQAIKDFNKAIELDPKGGAAYINRGNAYSSLGDHRQAIKDFDKAVELEPKVAAALGTTRRQSPILEPLPD